MVNRTICQTINIQKGIKLKCLHDSVQLIIQMSKIIDAHIQKEYKIGELLGSGAYGHVWRVEEKKTGNKFALKKVFGAFRNNIDAQRTYRQVEVLQKLKHQNIIKLQKIIRSTNKQDLYLLFQLMEADLMAVVGNILSVNHQKYILYQLLKGILHLHQCQLIHRDLKPSNVLMDSNCIVKICDFGLVRSIHLEDVENLILSEEVATKWYRAPQLLLGSRNYSFPVDSWSIGCIAAELLTGKTLFSGSSTLQQLEKIMQFTGLISRQDILSLDSPTAECLISQIKPKVRVFSDYFSLVNPIFYQLIKSLLQFNPEKRLSVRQALQLEIFQQYRDYEGHQFTQKSKAILLSLNDNQRYSIKDYRHQIYSKIKDVNSPTNQFSSQEKQSKLTKIKSQSKTSKKIIKSPAFLAKSPKRQFKSLTKEYQNQKKVRNLSNNSTKHQSSQKYLGGLQKINHLSPYRIRQRQLMQLQNNAVQMFKKKPKQLTKLNKHTKKTCLPFAIKK